MKFRQEDQAVATDILGYMLPYGQALQAKDSGKINFIKNKIQGKIENLSIETLRSVLQIVDQVQKEIEVDKMQSDQKLRLSGIRMIHDIVDVEINDKELNLVSAREKDKVFYDSIAQELYDCVSEIDGLKDLTKTRKLKPQLATERVIQQVERKVQFLQHEIERVAAELPQTVTASGATVKTKDVKNAPQVDTEGFRSSKAYKASPFSGEFPRDLFVEAEKSVESLQNSLKDVKESLEESSDKSASSKQQLTRLDRLSARLSIIGAYLKSFTEHLSPLKSRPLGITIPLKHRVETKLRDLMKAEKNSAKKEIFESSLKRLTEPKVKKAKVAEEKKAGFWSKKTSTSKRKSASKIDIIDDADELHEERKSKKSRRGKRSSFGKTL